MSMQTPKGNTPSTCGSTFGTCLGSIFSSGWRISRALPPGPSLSHKACRKSTVADRTLPLSKCVRKEDGRKERVNKKEVSRLRSRDDKAFRLVEHLLLVTNVLQGVWDQQISSCRHSQYGYHFIHMAHGQHYLGGRAFLKSQKGIRGESSNLEGESTSIELCNSGNSCSWRVALSKCWQKRGSNDHSVAAAPSSASN
jgi:hypothetical protein